MTGVCHLLRCAFWSGAALFAALLLLTTGEAGAQSRATPARPAVALHYGAAPPIDELQAFDIAVVDPDHAGDVAALPRRHTAWYAYVSVVEMQPTRSYFRDVPEPWQRGVNSDWGSRLIDQTAPRWREFFIERVVAPLWSRGFRGFFLDTLDSYHHFALTPEEKSAQEAALISLIEALHARFPGIALIFNRGFEILPRLKGRVAMVAAESLYLRYDAKARRYGEVPATDREWLTAQLRRVQAEHNVPVLVIDYAPYAQREAARQAAARIRADGFIPWVANGALDMLGVGDIEVEPRRVALVTDRVPGTDDHHATAVRYLLLPLHYLGYTVDVIDVAQRALPPTLADGRHAAVVTWFSQPVAALNPQFPAWLAEQIDAGVRLVMMNSPGIELDSALGRRLGFAPVRQPAGTLRIRASDPIVGFETVPPLVGRDVAPVRAAAAKPVLSLATAQGETIDAVGMTAWGGFALEPYAVVSPTLELGPRWIIDPIEFLRRALGEPMHPVPDVSTEGGRRLLLVHIDGDGFPSRAEMPGTPFAGEALLREIFQRYRIPHTMSVIQGEIAENGMYPNLAPALEAIARRMFALPHVEIASHSYSHPFFWRALAEAARGDPAAARYGKVLNLRIPGYKFDLDAELAGSAVYIDRQLAPAGKRTKVFLWTGDTVPTTEAVLAADRAGLLNMNGGDTLATRSDPSLARMSGLGLRRGHSLQVFAPNQNENVYTNNWTGPYYGFQRVIETFELTEAPRRLKPINIYYHTYSASKQAALAALHRVYGWALAQPTVPVYASDYIRKVHDFHRLVIARDLTSAAPAWRIRGEGELRTLRIGSAQRVDLAASRAVAGVAGGPGGQYVHLTDAAAELRYAQAQPARIVHVREARGWMREFSRSPSGISFSLLSYTAAGFTLASAEGCRARADGRELAAAATDQATVRYDLPAGEVSTTPALSRVDVVCR
jgi:hypothetical protein